MMERLTDKYGTTSCDNLYRVLKNGKINEFVVGGKAIAKLKEFEDLMEEQGFEDLQDLEKYIALTIKSSEIVAKKRQEIRTLKGNWAKLREFVGHERICVDDGFQEVYDAYGCVLDKMQELESADGEL